MSVITVTDISKSYKGTPLFTGATFTIEAGHTYGLIGPNGSGKSVLMKILCGFTLPDSGEVTISHRFLDKTRSFPDRFGVAIDGPAYLPGSTAKDNLLDLAAIRRRIGRSEVEAVLERVGLDATLSQKVRHYSLGMKQKLSLAQALMEDPEVLILDEPFNALDAEAATRVRGILKEEQLKGTTIVFTSHDRADIDALSSDLLQIDGNALLVSATLNWEGPNHGRP